MDKAKGSVLMVSLWVLAFLVVLAIGLGHRAAVDLKSSRLELNSLRAWFLAKSGLNKTMAIIDNNFLDAEGKEPKDLYSSKFSDDIGSFEVGYRDALGNFIFGPLEEDGKVNVNPGGLDTDFQKALLKNLFINRDVSYPEELADALIQWTSSDNSSTLAKREKFSVAEELLLVFADYYSQRTYLAKINLAEFINK